MIKKAHLWMLGCSVLALSGLSRAYALSITPGRTEVHLRPGQKTTAIITVTNDHPEKLNIEVTQKNWFMYETNKDIPVSAWLKINGKTHFTLKPGKVRQVPITISCPPKAEGLLVGMTSFTFKTENPGMLTPMISVSVYLSVDGTQHASGEIKRLGARIWEKKLSVGVEVQATGNMHLRPSGLMTVLNDQGVQVATYRINEGEPVYPGQVRGFSGVRQGENSVLPAGAYVLKAHLISNGVTLDAERKFKLLGDGKVLMEGEDKPS